MAGGGGGGGGGGGRGPGIGKGEDIYKYAAIYSLDLRLGYASVRQRGMVKSEMKFTRRGVRRIGPDALNSHIQGHTATAPMVLTFISPLFLNPTSPFIPFLYTSPITCLLHIYPHNSIFLSSRTPTSLLLVPSSSLNLPITSYLPILTLHVSQP